MGCKICANFIFLTNSGLSSLEKTLIAIVILLVAGISCIAFFVLYKSVKRRNIRNISEEKVNDSQETDGYSFINKINSTIASGVAESPEVFAITTETAGGKVSISATDKKSEVDELKQKLETKEGGLDPLIEVIIGLKEGLTAGKDALSGEEIAVRLGELERTMSEINMTLKEIKSGSAAKRGRPRKTAIAPEPAVKRGRGRPRKTVDPAKLSAVKRGRGRPRKEK